MSATTRAAIRTEGLAHTVEDARRHERESTLHVVAMQALLLSALTGLAPVAVLVLLPLLYTRFALSIHELMHSPGSTKVNPLLRLLPLHHCGVTVGYEQLRALHLAHHAHAGTDRDPERVLIEAPRLRAMLLGLFASERISWRWFRDHPLTPRLAAEAGLRAAFLAAVAWTDPLAWLTYVVLLRLAMGGGEFFFHHVLHMADREARRRWMTFPAPVLRVARWLLGADKMMILFEHEAHHAYPAVGAGHLGRVRAMMAAGEG